MLHNTEHAIPAMMGQLREGPYSFHLTGSRRWKTNRPNSDWDFFALDDDGDLCEWLVGIGFLQNFEEQYNNDSNCSAVLEHVDPDTGVVIQVQIVRDVKAKLDVQEALLRIYPNGFSDKSQATLIWEQAFEFRRLFLSFIS